MPPAFGDDSKAALTALLQDLPNPAGVLQLSLHSDAGIGPARFMGLALGGRADSAALARTVFNGARVDARWTPDLPE